MPVLWQALYFIVTLSSIDAKKPSQHNVKAKENEYVKDRDYLVALGERVREARAKRGLSRKLLAADSGVSERYLAQLESGQGNASVLLLRQIARALDLQPTELLAADSGESM